MAFRADWERKVECWVSAGVIDGAAADRIRAYEDTQSGWARLRWPIWVALVFGAIAIGAGILLFVSSHWDSLSPASRFTLVLILVGVFHVAGAITADRFRGLATALHAVGTVALGAGVALAGQIFNLDEHWPGGVMLWAIGAALGWGVLRDPPQFALAALLTPAWLTSEWIDAIEPRYPGGLRVLACGHVLLALTYFSAPSGDRMTANRRVLLWLGVGALLPAALFLAWQTTPNMARMPPPPAALAWLGWTVAIGVPLALAAVLRGTAAWPNAVAAAWVVVLLDVHAAGDLAVYGWWAVAGVGMAAWGVRDTRGERINVGAAIFAATVLTFYFSEVMDKLERSASLVGLGLLFLGGGWALERFRRRLVMQTTGAGG